MKPYSELTKEELLALKAELDAAFEDVKGKGMKLDMSRARMPFWIPTRLKKRAASPSFPSRPC